MDIDLDAPRGVAQQTPGDFPRGPGGAPYVTDPAGGTVKSGPRAGQPKLVVYRRMSGLGADLDDRSGLQRHDIRQIIRGLTVDDPDLTAQLVEYAHSGDVALADRIADRARALAGSHLAADRGTHIHRITEWVDLGADPAGLHAQGVALGLEPAVQDAIAAVWADFVGEHGLDSVAVETRVVHDPWRAAGTLDRIVRLDHDLVFESGDVLPAGTHCVLDLKSGQLRDRRPGPWWNAHTAQLSGYAGARPYDPDSGERTDWPFEVEQRWALIAHVPAADAIAGQARASLILVDIAAGRDAVERLVLPIGEWRRARGLFAAGATIVAAAGPAADDDDDDEFGLDAAARPAATATDDDDEFGLGATSGPAETPGPVADDDDEFGLGNAPGPGPAARTVRHDFGFVPQADPGPARAVPHDPTVEGSVITETERTVLVSRVANLDPAAVAVLETVARAAAAAGRPISLAAGPTERRQAIYRAVCRLAEEFAGDLETDHLRALVAVVDPDAGRLDSNIGAHLGAVTLDQAHTLAGVARRIGGSEAACLTYADDRVAWRL